MGGRRFNPFVREEFLELMSWAIVYPFINITQIFKGVYLM